MAASTRRPLIAGNWKMNLDHVAAIRLIQELALRLRGFDHDGVDVAVHPPFTDLRSVEGVIGADQLPILLGAQHCSAHEEGAYTGEVSLAMLARLSVSLVIVGHSERRQLFAMSDDDVAATARAVLMKDLIPVICVGETGLEREERVTNEVLARQVRAALGGVPAGLESDMVIAYEPIWAIGTGLAATAEDAQRACVTIRTLIAEARGEVADQVRILYGGSAKAENAAEFLALADVDGLLVGGASLDAESFAAIVAAAADCYGR
jgi:triosephosphate isomerase